MSTLTPLFTRRRKVYYFIHFGCWNKGKCDMGDATKSGVSAVMRRIKTFIEGENTQPPEFISVAGDNYYPYKTKNTPKEKGTKTKGNSDPKLKIIVESELNSGFECLKSIDKTIPIKIIMGNHDLETNIPEIPEWHSPVQSATVVDPEIKAFPNPGLYYASDATTQSIIGPANDCPMVQLEKKATTQSNMKLQVDFLDKDDIPVFGQNTLVLMIDTSMYETEHSELDQYDKCYPKITRLPSYTDIGSLRNNQLGAVLTAIQINDTKRNIVVIGHHPITGYIIKKDTPKLI